MTMEELRKLRDDIKKANYDLRRAQNTVSKLSVQLEEAVITYLEENNAALDTVVDLDSGKIVKRPQKDAAPQEQPAEN